MKKTMDEYGRLGRKSESDKLREKYSFEWYLKNHCDGISVDEMDKEDLDFFKGSYDNFIGVELIKKRGY